MTYSRLCKNTSVQNTGLLPCTYTLEFELLISTEIEVIYFHRRDCQNSLRLFVYSTKSSVL